MSGPIKEYKLTSFLTSHHHKLMDYVREKKKIIFSIALSQTQLSVH